MSDPAVPETTSLSARNGAATASPVCFTPRASIVVTCKGRLRHLQETLGTMLGQDAPFPFEVIVVDYQCPDNTFQWCRSLNVRGLVAMRVLDSAETFNLSRARNCGANLASGRVLGFVDADMRLSPQWLLAATEPIFAGVASLTRPGTLGPVGADRCGTCAVSARLFRDVRGYDERFVGWGSEDHDFYQRCAAIAADGVYPASLLDPILHTNADRVRFYQLKSINDSNARNLEYQRSRGTIVNPLGYGAGRFEIFEGSQPPSAVPRALLFAHRSRRRIHRQLRR